MAVWLYIHIYMWNKMNCMWFIIVIQLIPLCPRVCTCGGPYINDLISTLWIMYENFQVLSALTKTTSYMSHLSGDVRSYVILNLRQAATAPMTSVPLHPQQATHCIPYKRPTASPISDPLHHQTSTHCTPRQAPPLSPTSSPLHHMVTVLIFWLIAHV